MVVAGERERAALGRGPGEIGVAQGVAGSIDAGPFAVPDPEHPLDCGAGEARDVLRSPDGGRRELLIQAGAKDDVETSRIGSARQSSMS